MRDYLDRARTAYNRNPDPNEPRAVAQTPANTSGVRKHAGREYVVLENANGVLAVYLIRNDRLKRLREWPAAL